MVKSEVEKALPEHLQRICVVFLKFHAPYNPGEVAGFFPKKALQLIKCGAAEYADKEAAKAGAEAEKKAKAAALAQEVEEQEEAKKEIAKIDRENKKRKGKVV